jgi:putative tricarboxylic transport membrane protein
MPGETLTSCWTTSGVVERPISAFFLFLCVALLAAQFYVRLRKPKALAALDVVGHEAKRSDVAIGRPAA